MKVEFIMLDKVLDGVNEWKGMYENVAQFLEKQKEEKEKGNGNGNGNGKNNNNKANNNNIINKDKKKTTSKY
jgi:hypothetical protein